MKQPGDLQLKNCSVFAFWVMFITVRILGDVERLILQTGTKDFIRFLTSPKMRTGALVLQAGGTKQLYKVSDITCNEYGGSDHSFRFCR